jgi:hypothetical protein
VSPATTIAAVGRRHRDPASEPDDVPEVRLVLDDERIDGKPDRGDLMVKRDEGIRQLRGGS